jgi:hypothetical protein
MGSRANSGAINGALIFGELVASLCPKIRVRWSGLKTSESLCENTYEGETFLPSNCGTFDGFSYWATCSWSNAGRDRHGRNRLEHDRHRFVAWPELTYRGHEWPWRNSLARVRLYARHHIGRWLKRRGNWCSRRWPQLAPYDQSKQPIGHGWTDGPGSTRGKYGQPGAWQYVRYADEPSDRTPSSIQHPTRPPLDFSGRRSARFSH